MSYYIADNGQQRGPFTVEQLAAQGLRGDTLVWSEGMAQWLPAAQVPDLRQALAPSPAATYPPYGPPAGIVPPTPPMPYATAGAYAPAGYAASYSQPEVSSKKMAAGICGILLGAFGVHKFVLGYTTAGVIMLLTTILSCGFAAIIPSVIGLVEGILYLTKTDEQFYHEYVANQKPWF